ncbi:MAG: extracellular solute-binding protein [Clostridia bacterium]|nr:extracellular solute-binding protein [Clostridia bacterium]
MRKCTALCLLIVSFLWTFLPEARAVTLRTVSCFAGADAAAGAYVEILKDYEQRTGNTVEDRSATSDEAWKASVIFDFAAGNEPDVLFYFAARADSAPILYKVVPIDEINAAYPALHLPENPALTESDGHTYAIPVRGYWEGLFVNTDLFAEYGLPLPDTWEHLEEAIAGFREAGVVPIAISLSDIPHYLAEFALIACGGEAALRARPQSTGEVPESWIEAMRLIRHLWELGAFAENAAYTDEASASALFSTRRAAMKIDGSWFANMIDPTRMEATQVLPVPAYAPEGGGVVVGGISMGFYLTRRAWEDRARREAAVDLFASLTGEENRIRFGGYEYTGALLESALRLTNGANVMVSPLQDAMSREAREAWLLGCLPSLAQGHMSVEELWERVMALSPFAN